MTERLIEQTLREGFESKGGMCFKFIPSYLTGFPDRIGLMPGGRIFFIELKRPSGILSARQRFVHRQLEALGFPVIILWSIEQVNNFIDDL